MELAITDDGLLSLFANSELITDAEVSNPRAPGAISHGNSSPPAGCWLFGLYRQHSDTFGLKTLDHGVASKSHSGQA
ncbi:hypothetical protein J6590_071188 [Homalodisca vitripennis]|nr:hypothetical protein J6590_071188 [Homalodisca vitripennis]